MQIVERSALVTFTAAQMFALVDDVERYPEFLPWCTAARVRPVAPLERIATVDVARGPVRTAFTTRNLLTPDAQISMRLVEGPFKALLGEWRFEPVGERGSRVGFRVEFEFKGRIAAAMFGSAFEAICGSVVEAFVLRARALYG